MYKMIILSPGDHLFDRHEVVMCIVMCACISHLKRVDWPRLVHFWSHHRCSIFSMFSSFLSLVMAGETRYAMICTQCWAGMILIARAVRSCLSEHLENHAALFNCPKVMRTSQPSTHNQTIPGQFHQDCGIDYLLWRSKPKLVFVLNKSVWLHILLSKYGLAWHLLFLEFLRHPSYDWFDIAQHCKHYTVILEIVSRIDGALLDWTRSIAIKPVIDLNCQTKIPT